MYKLDKKIKSKNNSRKPKLLISIFLALILIVLVLAYMDNQNFINLPFLHNKKVAPTPTGSINYNPPTKQEAKETQEFKKNIDPSTNNSPVINKAPESQHTSVKPIISSWGSDKDGLWASGFVPGVVEANGTCILTATFQSNSVTESIQATPNAQNVSCGLIKIPISKLSPGTWTIKLSYTSAKYQGVSDNLTQEVN